MSVCFVYCCIPVPRTLPGTWEVLNKYLLNECSTNPLLIIISLFHSFLLILRIFPNRHSRQILLKFNWNLYASSAIYSCILQDLSRKQLTCPKRFNGKAFREGIIHRGEGRIVVGSHCPWIIIAPNLRLSLLPNKVDIKCTACNCAYWTTSLHHCLNVSNYLQPTSDWCRHTSETHLKIKTMHFLPLLTENFSMKA